MDEQKYAVSGLLQGGKLAYASTHTFCDDRFGPHTVFDLKDAVERYFAVIGKGGTYMQIRPVISMSPLMLGERLSAERIEERRKSTIAEANAPKAA